MQLQVIFTITITWIE